MLSIESLKAFGADTDEALQRCMNNEAFYLKLVGNIIADQKIFLLKNQQDNNKMDLAFETAHSLKGIYGNLSLTPIYVPVNALTELLRNRTQTDYSPLMNEIIRQKALLDNLA